MYMCTYYSTQGRELLFHMAIHLSDSTMYCTFLLSSSYARLTLTYRITSDI